MQDYCTLIFYSFYFNIGLNVVLSSILNEFEFYSTIYLHHFLVFWILPLYTTFSP
jgi:hypothetical protein